MQTTANHPVDIMLADGNPLVLSAMSEIFERDQRFSLVATAATAEGFLGMAMRVPVAVAVLDWSLPVLGAPRLIEVLRQQERAPKIVIYGDVTNDTPLRAMEVGAAGFVSRSSAVENLLDTCAEVARGKMVFPFVDVRKMNQDPISSLSKKERAILDALATGQTNREISKSIGVSPNTVKFHLSNIYEKLSVKNRTQAIAYYFAAAAQTNSGI
ncbi:LuxR C-terminal-related transcriptional regulator [Cognatishimia sp.]|uniref:LuxR C-terminal-related transcriptional regulator n=1 Tax=Cognatishimia sp. TaxID=2211648 RepID=UPI0035186189